MGSGHSTGGAYGPQGLLNMEGKLVDVFLQIQTAGSKIQRLSVRIKLYQ